MGKKSLLTLQEQYPNGTNPRNVVGESKVHSTRDDEELKREALTVGT